MKDLSTVSHHPAIEEIVDVLCNKLQNNDRAMFRVTVAYFLAKMASSMRTTVFTKDRGAIPVNLYALLTAVSGSGKGYAIHLMEESFLKGFKSKFLETAFPIIAEQNMHRLAGDRMLRSGKTYEQEFDKIASEFKDLGALPFTFDSGTSPAIKQLRQKLLIADIGSINLQIDEIGSNLISATDVLNTFLELYDQGLIKQKLTKNTAENQRAEEMDGNTPANMLLFGAPSKLLDGGKNEDEFYQFLEVGYARRCFFSNGTRKPTSDDLSPAQIYYRLISQSDQTTISKWASHFQLLADPTRYNWQIHVSDDVSIELLTYKINCENAANLLPEHEEVKRAEMAHRYMKALKLAGALAFIDEATDMTLEHLNQALKLTEESGKAFQTILNREKSYVKLAKYIASVNQEVTHADLNTALPFYKTSAGARNEQIGLAQAWGYKNNIIIKKTFTEGIEFFKGETLSETDLSKLIISYSEHMAYRYISEEISLTNLIKLSQFDKFHWVNHHLVKGKTGEGHRDGNNILSGFNLVVIDVDGGTPLAIAQKLLKEFTFVTYTTKRHTIEENRFRVILPLKYTLKLDEEEFKEFMANIHSWLPFSIGLDDSTFQRCRKWETFNRDVFSNEGVLLDPLKFIPKTSKNEEFKKSIADLESMENVERWFAERMVTGDRNNNILKFAMLLKDTGLPHYEVEQRVKDFNNKLFNKLSIQEMDKTILKTLAKAYI